MSAFDGKPLITERLAVLLPANHRLAHLAAVTFADLAGETLLLQERICLRRNQ